MSNTHSYILAVQTAAVTFTYEQKGRDVRCSERENKGRCEAHVTVKTASLGLVVTAFARLSF